MIPRMTMNGDEQFRQALNDLPEKLRNKVLRSALREAFKPTMARIRAKTPEDRGALKNSWHLRAYKGRRRRGRLGVYIASGTREQLGIPADAQYYYPAALEFGTEKMGAQSFVRSELRADESEIYERLRHLVHVGIEGTIAREIKRLMPELTL